MGISIVGLDPGHKAGVSHSLTMRDIGATNLKKISDSRHTSDDTLCEPAKVVGNSVGPNAFVWTCDKIEIIHGFDGDFVNHGICTGGTPAGFRGQ